MFFPVYQITGFVLQRGKNEVILVQIRPFASSKNKSKQTLCDSCIVLVSMCMYIWSSSCVFTMSYYVILLCYIKGWYTYDVHENYPIFKTPPALLVHLRPDFFPSLDLGRPILNQPPPHSPNDNQSVKRKHNPRMTIVCYLVLPSGRPSLLVSTH